MPGTQITVQPPSEGLDVQADYAQPRTARLDHDVGCDRKEPNCCTATAYVQGLTFGNVLHLIPEISDQADRGISIAYSGKVLCPPVRETLCLVT